MAVEARFCYPFGHMANPTKPLPGAGQLIGDSWKLFTSTWNTSVKTSIYFLYAGLAMFAAAVLTKLNGGFSILEGSVGLAAGLFIIWVTIRLYMTMLNLEAGKQPMAPGVESKTAWALYFPYIFVVLLVGLATLAGFVLIIIPGIYLAVAFAFSQVILVDQGIRGTQALAASRALVKGRWWASLWRLLAGGVVFGLLIAIVVGVLVAIATALVGTEAMSAANPDPVIAGAMNLLQYASQAAFMPLFLGFTVKVYRALQKTR